MGRLAQDTLYVNSRLALEPDGRNVLDSLRQAFSTLPQGIYKPQVIDTAPIRSSMLIPPEYQDKLPSGSYVFTEGKLWQSTGWRLYESELTGLKKDRVVGLLSIRDALDAVYEVQLNRGNDDELSVLQAELNRVYDSFVAKHGWVHDNANKRVFYDDRSFPSLLALETYNPEKPQNTKKTDVFSERVIVVHQTPSFTESAKDGLLYSLDKYGRLDLSYVCQLTQQSAETVIQQLVTEDLIFYDPSQELWFTSEEYLSGDVVEKLEIAQTASETDPDLIRNVEALKSIQPQPLLPGEIDVHLGATWVPAEIYEQFLNELYKIDAEQGSKWGSKIDISFTSVTSEFNVDVGWSIKNCVANTKEYGTNRVLGTRLYELALNGKQPVVYDKVTIEGKERSVKNVEATQAACLKQELIKEKFVHWIWTDLERTKQLADLYNERFNSHRHRQYNGQHLRFPDMNPVWENRLQNRPHQINAIWRGLSERVLLLAHGTGKGKTAELITLAYEANKRGLVRNPVIVVRNNLLEQFGSDYKQIYPSANILLVSGKNLDNRRREELVARISTGKFDSILMTQSAFDRIDVGPRIVRDITRDRQTEVASEMRKAGSSNLKSLERAKEKAAERVLIASQRNSKDQGITWDMLGSTGLFIDEVHDYNAQDVESKLNGWGGNVLGIPSGSSGRAEDLKLKAWYTQKQDGMVVTASATPLSNAIVVDVWVHLNLLKRKVLKDFGIESCDSYIKNFGKIVTKAEVTEQGTLAVRSRLCEFQNTPEIRSIFGQVADVVRGKTPGVKEPIVEYHELKIPASPPQKKFFQWVAERGAAIRDTSIETDDNCLSITNDIIDGVIDLRLLPYEKLSQFLTDTEIQQLSSQDGKLSGIAKQALLNWQAGSELRTTQIIFCDRGVPKPGFNSYNALKEELLKEGIPEIDIAFAHDYKSDAEKQSLREMIRNREKRLVIASTDTMGVGANVQDFLEYIINVDCPWTPKSLEQRIGRMERQGNNLEKTYCFNTVIVGEPQIGQEGIYGISPDSYRWGVVAYKQNATELFLGGQRLERNLTVDTGPVVLNPNEIMATASGDERLIERSAIQSRIKVLEIGYGNHVNERYTSNREISRINRDIQALERGIDNWIADQGRGIDFDTTDFRIELQGLSYSDPKKVSKLLETIGTECPLGATQVGHVGGFTLEVVNEMLSQKRFSGLHLVGEGRYPVNRRFGDFVYQLKAHLRSPNHLIELKQDYERKIEQLENVIDQPFPFQEELEQLKVRLYVIEEELGLRVSDFEMITEDTHTASEDESLASNSELAQTIQADELETPADIPSSDAYYIRIEGTFLIIGSFQSIEDAELFISQQVDVDLDKASCLIQDARILQAEEAPLYEIVLPDEFAGVESKDKTISDPKQSLESFVCICQVHGLVEPIVVKVFEVDEEHLKFEFLGEAIDVYNYPNLIYEYVISKDELFGMDLHSGIEEYAVFAAIQKQLDFLVALDQEVEKIYSSTKKWIEFLETSSLPAVARTIFNQLSPPTDPSNIAAKFIYSESDHRYPERDRNNFSDAFMQLAVRTVAYRVMKERGQESKTPLFFRSAITPDDLAEGEKHRYQSAQIESIENTSQNFAQGRLEGYSGDHLSNTDDTEYLEAYAIGVRDRLALIASIAPDQMESYYFDQGKTEGKYQFFSLSTQPQRLQSLQTEQGAPDLASFSLAEIEEPPTSLDPSIESPPTIESSSEPDVRDDLLLVQEIAQESSDSVLDEPTQASDVNSSDLPLIDRAIATLQDEFPQYSFIQEGNQNLGPLFNVESLKIIGPDGTSFPHEVNQITDIEHIKTEIRGREAICLHPALAFLQNAYSDFSFQLIDTGRGFKLQAFDPIQNQLLLTSDKNIFNTLKIFQPEAFLAFRQAFYNLNLGEPQSVEGCIDRALLNMESSELFIRSEFHQLKLGGDSDNELLLIERSDSKLSIQLFGEIAGGVIQTKFDCSLSEGILDLNSSLTRQVDEDGSFEEYSNQDLAFYTALDLLAVAPSFNHPDRAIGQVLEVSITSELQNGSRSLNELQTKLNYPTTSKAHPHLSPVNYALENLRRAKLIAFQPGESNQVQLTTDAFINKGTTMPDNQNSSQITAMYTDGSCRSGDGGYGVHIQFQDGSVHEIGGQESGTTNNRMELQAAISALTYYHQLQQSERATIFLDSQYVKNGITSWISNWRENGFMNAARKPVQNQDLWMKLDELNTSSIQWEWVKGHSKNPGNERADQIAGAFGKGQLIELQVKTTSALPVAENTPDLDSGCIRVSDDRYWLLNRIRGGWNERGYSYSSLEALQKAHAVEPASHHRDDAGEYWTVKDITLSGLKDLYPSYTFAEENSTASRAKALVISDPDACLTSYQPLHQISLEKAVERIAYDIRKHDQWRNSEGITALREQFPYLQFTKTPNSSHLISVREPGSKDISLQISVTDPETGAFSQERLARSLQMLFDKYQSSRGISEEKQDFSPSLRQQVDFFRDSTRAAQLIFARAQLENDLAVERGLEGQPVIARWSAQYEAFQVDFYPDRLNDKEALPAVSLSSERYGVLVLFDPRDLFVNDSSIINLDAYPAIQSILEKLAYQSPSSDQAIEKIALRELELIAVGQHSPRVINTKQLDSLDNEPELEDIYEELDLPELEKFLEPEAAVNLESFSVPTTLTPSNVANQAFALLEEISEAEDSLELSADEYVDDVAKLVHAELNKLGTQSSGFVNIDEYREITIVSDLPIRIQDEILVWLQQEGVIDLFEPGKDGPLAQADIIRILNKSNSNHLVIETVAQSVQPPLTSMADSSKLKVLSIGEPGASMGVLQAAQAIGIATGGTTPINSPESQTFGQRILEGETFENCFKANLSSADGTLLIGNSGKQDTKQLITLATQYSNPTLLVSSSDLEEPSKVAEDIKKFIVSHNISVLNVGGDRESIAPGIQDKVKQISEQVFSELSQAKDTNGATNSTPEQEWEASIQHAKAILPIAYQLFARVAEDSQLKRQDEQGLVSWVAEVHPYQISYFPFSDNLSLQNLEKQDFELLAVEGKIQLDSTGGITQNDYQNFLNYSNQLSSAEFADNRSPREVVAGLVKAVKVAPATSESSPLSHSETQLRQLFEKLGIYEQLLTEPSFQASFEADGYPPIQVVKLESGELYIQSIRTREGSEFRVGESEFRVKSDEGNLVARLLDSPYHLVPNESVVSVEQLIDWYRQAHALGRSDVHLGRIEAYIKDPTKKLLDITTEVMGKDLKAFGELAAVTEINAKHVLNGEGRQYGSTIATIGTNFAIATFDQTLIVLAKDEKPQKRGFELQGEEQNHLPDSITDSSWRVILQSQNHQVNLERTSITLKDARAIENKAKSITEDLQRA